MEIETSVEALKDLRRTASNAYDADARIGSPRWLASSAADKAVLAFEAAHPEAVAEINRKLVEERRARLAGRDIMGM